MTCYLYNNHTLYRSNAVLINLGWSLSSLKRQVGFVRIGFTLLLTTLLVGSASLVVSAQTEEGEYYSETGHNVREPFYNYFKDNGGISRFGYPITEAYLDSTNLLVQYFQKARLEWHPGNPEPYTVILGPLSEELGKKQAPILANQIPAATDPNCLYFVETGHKVCNSFLKYFRGNGGVTVFGYPITEYIQENGRIVQYFQFALFEWHPNKPAGQRVLTANLGQIYYDWAKLDRTRLLPVEPITAQPQSTLVTLKANASVLSAITSKSKGDAQTGYVYVYDQLGRPISGAGVTLVVRFPNGSSATYTLPSTNTNGIAFQTFPVGNAKPGQMVVIEFIVTYDGQRTTTRTSYMMWYY